MIAFRALKAEEVECRVGQQAPDRSWVTLLLYKNQRTDANILDETVKAENWQDRYYEVKGNLFCSVGIRCGDEWVYKDNCGTESFSESEKGEASDAFKRACFNWGIGRELYTSPLVYVPKTDKRDGKDNYDVDDKRNVKANFVVTFMKVRDGKIVGLNIENTKKHRTVFAWGDLNEDLD